jgi:ATP-dependent Clp protease ATP-binding subunit ClpB
VRGRLKDRKIELELTDEAKELLAIEGFDPVYGARPLKRAIQQRIVQPLAIQLLRGEFHDGDKILADARGGDLVFRRVDEPVAVAAGA